MDDSRMSNEDLALEPKADPEADADIAVLRQELAALKDQALRYAAEAENTKRRAERETNEARAYAISKFAKDLMAVADNLSRALEHAPADAEDPAARNLIVGLEMTHKALIDAFARNGLNAIAPKQGDRFDPHLHQAMMEQPSDTLAPGRIIQCLQSGYELFGRTLRAAMVVVTSRESTGGPPAESGGA